NFAHAVESPAFAVLELLAQTAADRADERSLRRLHLIEAAAAADDEAFQALRWFGRRRGFLENRSGALLAQVAANSLNRRGRIQGRKRNGRRVARAQTGAGLVVRGGIVSSPLELPAIDVGQAPGS